MTSTPEQTEPAPAAATAEPQATKKPRVGARRAHVAPAKATSAKKASPARKAPKRAKKATGTGPRDSSKATGTRKATSPRDGSKTAKILDLLKRPGGATAKELMKATGWQPHSLRGFISLLGSKGGHKTESSKNAAGERCYRVK
jgi:hypothetical protein